MRQNRVPGGGRKMREFITVTYTLPCSRLAAGRQFSFVLLADLHGKMYGEGQSRLLKAVCAVKPDMILCAGDMILRRGEGGFRAAQTLLCGLARDYPVYYAMGNHEARLIAEEMILGCSGPGRMSRITENSDIVPESGWIRTPSHKRGAMRELVHRYQEFEETIGSSGVQILINDHKRTRLHGCTVDIYGLYLPIDCYKKPFAAGLTADDITCRLGGRPAEDGFSILLAHHPGYAKSYFSWGADLTLSGHYHGGMVRLTKRIGLVSPEPRLFPPYCCGDFHKNGRHLLVSAGIGEHTIPIRIHNPRELVNVICRG